MEGNVDNNHDVFKYGEDTVDSRFTIVDMPPIAEYANLRKARGTSISIQ